MSGHLFTLPTDAFVVTSDDCYTPRWVFDAMGLEFDLDVAAPPGGPWHVPAKRPGATRRGIGLRSEPNDPHSTTRSRHDAARIR